MTTDTLHPSSINAFPASPSVTIPAALLQDLLDTIHELRDEVAQLHADRDQDRADFERFKATHRTFAVQVSKDIDALFEANLATTAKPETNKKTADHIDDLHRLMVEDRTQQISIAKGARLLGISKERMRQLKPLIMQDGRFEMGWGQVKGKKAVVIRIRQFL